MRAQELQSILPSALVRADTHIQGRDGTRILYNPRWFPPPSACDEAEDYQDSGAVARSPSKAPVLQYNRIP